MKCELPAGTQSFSFWGFVLELNWMWPWFKQGDTLRGTQRFFLLGFCCQKAPDGRGLEGLAKDLKWRCEEVVRLKGERIPK